MKKSWVDQLSKRKVVTFYFPFTHLADEVEKETSFHARRIMDAGQEVPIGMIFHKTGDLYWLKEEVKNSLDRLMDWFGRLTYGIDPEFALFYEKDFENTSSIGFTVNDYGRQSGQFKKDLDRRMEAFIVNQLCSDWYASNGYLDLAQIYEGKAVSLVQALSTGMDMLKRKKKQLRFPPDDHEYLPDVQEDETSNE